MARRKSERLTDRNEISRILKRGRRWRSALGLTVTEPAAGGRGRCLFIISSRVSKKSTVRNRLRRRLNEWARRENISQRLSKNVIVLVAPGAVNLQPAALHQSAAQALHDAERS